MLLFEANGVFFSTIIAFVENNYGVFFSTKKCALYLKKNAILYLFLKNVSPSKRMVYFILNNSHLPMVQGMVFNALYKSKILIFLNKVHIFLVEKKTP